MQLSCVYFFIRSFFCLYIWYYLIYLWFSESFLPKLCLRVQRFYSDKLQWRYTAHLGTYIALPCVFFIRSFFLAHLVLKFCCVWDRISIHTNSLGIIRIYSLVARCSHKLRRSKTIFLAPLFIMAAPNRSKFHRVNTGLIVEYFYFQFHVISYYYNSNFHIDGTCQINCTKITYIDAYREYMHTSILRCWDTMTLRSLYSNIS